MASLKLISVGTSTGVVIPKEMLTRMKVEKGDMLHAVEVQDGYLLTPYELADEKQLELGRKIMREYRDVFRALAK